MKSFIFKLSLFILCSQISLTHQISNVQNSQNTITINWTKSHEKETKEQAVLVLCWMYSYIGATLPKHESKLGIKIERSKIIVNISLIGLNEWSKDVLLRLHQKIKKTDEYEQNGTIDLGRYVALILGSSEHYYELTGLPKTYAELISNYEFNEEQGYINNSNVSKIHRIITISTLNNNKQLFVAQEYDSVEKQVLEFETMELLPNGQIRFGIYNKHGERILGVDRNHSNAGKPAKCIWCHESKIQPIYSKQDDIPNYISFNQLNVAIDKYRNLDELKKVSLVNGVNFSKREDHTLVEICYISFMEPSAERLSREWKLPVKKVKELLYAQRTHIHEEFPFLGVLYDRIEIEKFSRHKGISVSGNVRELSPVEVNHL